MFYREALNKALDEVMAADERVVVLGEDVGLYGGSYRVTEGLAAKYGEARVIDTPIVIIDRGSLDRSLRMCTGAPGTTDRDE